MASATNISATSLPLDGVPDPSAEAAGAQRTKLAATKMGPGRFSGALLIGNTVGIIVLVFAAFGISAYRDGLLSARTEMVERQAVLTRAALSPDALAACGDVSCLIRRAEAQRVLMATAAGYEGRLVLYRKDGDQLSFVAEHPEPALLAPDAVPISQTLPKAALPQSVGESLASGLEWLIFELPIRKRMTTSSIEEEVEHIIAGEGGNTRHVRYGEGGQLVASVSLPLIEDGLIAGVVVAESAGIDVVAPRIRQAMVPVTLLTLALGSLCAVMLTAAVTQPLRQLSAAAERVRASVGRAGQISLPDFDHRQDDIGRLSRSLRAMLVALVDRIESIDSFAADVSHELKNPLTSIRSAIETLDKCKTEAQRQKLLDVMAVDVDRMDRLISDISSASRLDAQLATQTRSPIAASSFFADVVESYKAVTKSGGPRVNFWDDTDGGLKVVGAPAALSRVLRNVIDNAISFSPDQGAVTVALEKPGGTRQDRLLVSVSDEGPGVPPENLESIFDRFYTSRPTGAVFGSNSGLGLAIARQIVESHGGRLWAENIPSDQGDKPAGARFMIDLPAHRGAPR